MANLLKFFRVSTLPAVADGVKGGLYFETSTGLIYICTGTAFEAYSGVRSAALANEVLTIVQHDGSELQVDLSGYAKESEIATELLNYVKKEQTIAGIDLQDNITVKELQTALGLTDINLAGEANVIETVQVNGEDLTIENETVNITVTEGTTDGTIAVNGKDVAVHGLGSAAYKNETAFDAAGTAAGLIAGLDKADTAVTGEYVSAVSETDGVITVSREKLPVTDVKYNDTSIVENYVAKIEKVVDTTVTANSANLVTSGAVSTAIDNVVGGATADGNTLGKLEDRIEAIVTNEKTYSVVKLTAAEVTALGNSNVKEAYKLIDEDKAAVGDPILIYKDSSLKSAAMGTGDNAQKLMLTYILADGSESEVPVDLSAFYAESETGDGLQLIDHVISVKKDATSEAFLSVSEAGVKLSGIQDAIDAAETAANTYTDEAIADLDATVGSQTVATGKHVAVEVVETDGVLTSLTVVEDDIASAAKLDAVEQVTAAALNNLNERLTEAQTDIEALEAWKEGLNTGVMSVTGDESNDYVKVAADTTDGAVTLGVTVDAVEAGATDDVDGLATAAYVREQVAAVAATADTAVQSVASAEGTIQVTSEGNDVNLELVWTVF